MRLDRIYRGMNSADETSHADRPLSTITHGKVNTTEDALVFGTKREPLYQNLCPCLQAVNPLFQPITSFFRKVVFPVMICNLFHIKASENHTKLTLGVGGELPHS